MYPVSTDEQAQRRYEEKHAEVDASLAQFDAWYRRHGVEHARERASYGAWLLHQDHSEALVENIRRAVCDVMAEIARRHFEAMDR
jgi:hypothetical protein